MTHHRITLIFSFPYSFPYINSSSAEQSKGLWFTVNASGCVVNWPITHLTPPPTSLRPALSGGGRHLRTLAQLLGQRGPVHLQRPGRAAHPDPLEAPGVGQQGRLLRQPLPRLLLAQSGHSGPGPLLQVEDGDRGLRRQYR